jgi:hypothetical protein
MGEDIEKTKENKAEKPEKPTICLKSPVVPALFILHSFIVRPAAAFGRHPVNDLVRVCDVAGLAVNAV